MLAKTKCDNISEHMSFVRSSSCRALGFQVHLFCASDGSLSFHCWGEVLVRTSKLELKPLLRDVCRCLQDCVIYPSALELSTTCITGTHLAIKLAFLPTSNALTATYTGAPDVKQHLWRPIVFELYPSEA